MSTAAEEYTVSATHRFHHQLINDREYLFRLSSTFAWEESIDFCNTCIFHVEQAASAAAAAATTAVSTDNNCKNIEYYDENPHKHTNIHENIHSLSLQQYIQYIHSQLTYIDQWGNTCLHAQCFCKPPVESVTALFRLARLLRRFSLCGDTNDNDKEMIILWATTCKDGSTPFHIAASTGASPEVLHCYISEIQYYIDQKWLPLNNLNNNDATTTATTSLYSEEWARKTIIRPDISGNTPLMGWMSHHYKWIKYQLSNLSSGVFSISSTPYLLEDYWDLAERMIRFATMVDENENDSVTTTTTTTTLELMQQCASISMYCPVSLLEWIVSPHRNGRSRCDNTIETSSSSSSWTAADVCAATPNETTGKLPFHVAMEAIPFQFDSSSERTKEVLRYTTNNPRLEMNRIQILKKLLIWYPHAADVPFWLMKSVAVDVSVAADEKQQDQDNVVDDDEKRERIVRRRSPFLQAIAIGGSWWCTIKADGTTFHDENDDVDNYMGLVQLLWRMNHHPGEIISKRDEVTGLYPFMLAGASSCDASCYVDNSDDDTTVVDTTYNLLRKDPQLVAGALSYGK